MDIVTVLGFIAAIFIGISLGLIGGGGSILTVPILVYLLNVNPVLATAYSLFVVGATSLAGSLSFMNKGLVNYKTAAVFAIPSFIVVYLTRQFLIPAIPEVIFSIGDFPVTKNIAIMVFFALIMLLAALSMIRDNRKNKPKHQAEGVKLNYPMIALEGAVVGVLTGIVGAGGGFLIIPALVLFARLPMKMAVGTSLLIIAVKSLIGFLGDVANQPIEWDFLLFFTGLSLGGIFIGSWLSTKINGKTLKKSFGWFVLVMAVYILVKNLRKRVNQNLLYSLLMKTNTKIAIVGAGIGGLTTALALKRNGFNADIFEASPELLPVGAGLALGANATQVFKKLEVYAQIRESGNTLNNAGLTDAHFKVISKQDVKTAAQKYGVDNIAIHRGDLQEILLSKISDNNLFLNKILKSIRQNKTAVSLDFQDKTSVEYDIVIGADGIHSATRASIGIKSSFRDAGQACWRGVVNMKDNLFPAQEFYEAWGKGKRFGHVYINKENIYWFAVISKNLVSKDSGKEFLLQAYKDFHPYINSLIEHTPTMSIIRNDLGDLEPLKIWHKGRVVLLGDAAHATTPNMGQGACQAIEDAYILSEMLKDFEYQEAFIRYEKLRMAKATWITNNSKMVGNMAHWQNGIAVTLRNLLLAATPKKVMLKQLHKIYTVSFNNK